MRTDMPKIITEPSRGGSGYNNLHNDYRQAKKFKLDEDLNVDDEFCSHVLPMRARKVGWKGKSSRFNYHIINRFLHSRVGSRWDDVYSEITSTLRSKTSKAQDLHRLFTQRVKTNTHVNADGFIYYNDHYSSHNYIDNEHGVFYVDPHDGILRLSSGKTYKSICRDRRLVRDTNEGTWLRKINEYLHFHKINGLWFQIRMKYVPETVRFCWYSKEIEYVSSSWKQIKKSASKADIKHYDLN